MPRFGGIYLDEGANIDMEMLAGVPNITNVLLALSFPRRPSIAKHAGGTTRFLRQFSENLQGYCVEWNAAHYPTLTCHLLIK